MRYRLTLHAPDGRFIAQAHGASVAPLPAYDKRQLRELLEKLLGYGVEIRSLEEGQADH